MTPVTLSGPMYSVLGVCAILLIGIIGFLIRREIARGDKAVSRLDKFMTEEKCEKVRRECRRELTVELEEGGVCMDDTERAVGRLDRKVDNVTNRINYFFSVMATGMIELCETKGEATSLDLTSTKEELKMLKEQARKGILEFRMGQEK